MPQLKLLMKKKDLKKNIPHSPGVYLFKDEARVLYIGKSNDLRERIFSYFGANLGEKTRDMVETAKLLDFVKVDSQLDALFLEAKLIRTYKPKYNIISKDDKSPLYIGITSDEFPKVLVLRERDLKAGAHKLRRDFGPFASQVVVRTVLKRIRKVFPYCQQKKLGTVCFWHHLGLCNPCPSDILKLTGKERASQRRLYLKNIKAIERVLSGKSTLVRSLLKKEMEKAAAKLLFEKAQDLRDQLARFDFLSQSQRLLVDSYLTNPNLAEDKRREELTQLFEILKNPVGLEKIPHHIECFDCSHLSGSLATASLVTFINGDREPGLYRHFRIRSKKRGDDLDYLKEVFERRFANPKMKIPDLIVVDGGRGQITAAKFVLLQTKTRVPLIGLAKREEEIAIPKASRGFITLKIGKDSPALTLLMRMRDEAHRFARSYHFKLRFKNLIPANA